MKTAMKIMNIASKIAFMHASTSARDPRQRRSASDRFGASLAEARVAASAAAAPGAPSWGKAALGFGASLFLLTIVAFGASML